MTLEDKVIECFDCKASFTFTVAEQGEFQAKGYTNAPKRCPACRQARKERQGNENARKDTRPTFMAERRMFPATCSRCGKTTEVPFEPREGRSVYCRDCYSTVRVSR
jgi:CxxC-x17-CxxC domain-containing protein